MKNDLSESYTRDLDLRYLGRSDEDCRRPYFASVADHLQMLSSKRKFRSLADVGCASGAFIRFIGERFPELELTGVDALADLVRKAASENPKAEFVHGDIMRAETLPARTYDAVTLLTLNSHFDTTDVWLDNAIALTRAGGVLLVYGPFNSQPVDTAVRLRLADQAGSAWLPGWSIQSMASIEKALDGKSISHHFHPLTVSYPTEQTASGDPLSSRLVSVNGQPMVCNGAGLLLAFYLLEINV